MEYLWLHFVAHNRIGLPADTEKSLRHMVNLNLNVNSTSPGIVLMPGVKLNSVLSVVYTFICPPEVSCFVGVQITV